MTIKSYFFGKNCVIDRELKNRFELNSKLKEEGFNFEKVLFVNQIHGAEVVVVDSREKIHGDQNLPKADALVTNLPNLVIGVITADCSPILLFDEDKKIIAAIHAGWRGAKAGVIAATVNEMKKLGAKNISAMIGPMIQQDSYEVSKEFLDDFLQENLQNIEFFRNAAAPDKFLFDLNSYVEKKLYLQGVERVINDKIDTYKNEENLFSFRRSTHREEKDCGRNISVIAVS